MELNRGVMGEPPDGLATVLCNLRLLKQSRQFRHQVSGSGPVFPTNAAGKGTFQHRFFGDPRDDINGPHLNDPRQAPGRSRVSADGGAWYARADSNSLDEFELDLFARSG